MIDRVHREIREVGLSELVGEEHARRLSKLLTAINHVQWSNIEPHRNRYPVLNAWNGPVFPNCDFTQWDAEICRLCMADDLLDGTVDLRPLGARLAGDCSV